MKNVPMELEFILGDATDEVAIQDDAPDPFQKFLADAGLAGSLHMRPDVARAHVENFAIESAALDARLAKRKLSGAETKYFTKVAAWMKKAAAEAGTTASAFIENWIAEQGENINPDVAADVRQIAAELA